MSCKADLVIIDYGLGNLGSMFNMLKKVGINATISSDHEIIKKAHRLILPGVGSFDAGMEGLRSRELLVLLENRVLHDCVPILGICLGMQLMTKRSDEGMSEGLSWIDAETVKFDFDDSQKRLKIPHMGWNTLRICKDRKLFSGIEEEPRFYFVHSYHVVCRDKSDILTQTSYGYEFVSAVSKYNITGVQFHPEKSHKYGMNLLKNWVDSTSQLVSS